MQITQRLRAELRSRGWAGLLGFLATRLWQRREDILFELRLADGRFASPPSHIENPVVVSRENIGSAGTAAAERDVLTDQNYAYRSALLGKDLLFAAMGGDGHVSAYGFVLFDTPYKRILGEATDVPMIGNCYTFPSHRRHGLYASLLIAIARQLADRGYARVIISCAPDNAASIRGIQRAGFSRVRQVRSLLVLSHVVFRAVTGDE